MDNIRGSVHASGSPRQASTPTPGSVSSGAPQSHPAPSTSSSRSKKPKSKRAKTILIIIAALLIAALIGFFVYRSSSAQLIDTSKYQAVFFTNGQVYFGKLEQVDGGHLKLTKVFYLQTKTDMSAKETDSKNPQETSTSSDVQLIKLGDEVHGPEDEMIINKEQVLFYENLKSDSKVSSSIEEYLNKK